MTVRPPCYDRFLKHQSDWVSLFRAFSEAFEWALDLAGGLADGYPEEVACVERVRTFLRKRIAGDPAHIRLDDLLFTFGLIAGAMERDVRPKIAAPRRAPARTLRRVQSARFSGSAVRQLWAA